MTTSDICMANQEIPVSLKSALLRANKNGKKWMQQRPMIFVFGYEYQNSQLFSLVFISLAVDIFKIYNKKKVKKLGPSHTVLCCCSKWYINFGL